MTSPSRRSTTVRLLDNSGSSGLASPTSSLSDEPSPCPRQRPHRNTTGCELSSGGSGKKSKGRLSMLKSMAKLTISNKRKEETSQNDKENSNINNSINSPAKVRTVLQIEPPKTDNTYNENLAIKKKKMLWGCLVCLNRHNHISSPACSTCGVCRPTNRFGHKDSQGRFYLCIADTSTVIPTLSLYRVSNDPDSSKNSHRATRIVMYHSSDILSECVAAAFKNWEKDADDGSVESAGTQHSLGSYQEKRSRAPDSVWPRDPTKTLYDQVLANASSSAYDPSIGRFVDKELAAESPVKLHENMVYKHNMESTRKELSKQVQEVKSRREASEAKRFLYDFQPPSKDEPRASCGLCELELPLSQMLGRITFRAISYWRQRHNAPISAGDVRMTATKIFNATPICLFCTQFFDEDFGSNVVDRAALQEQLGFSRRHSYSKQQNFSNKAYKKILSNFLDTNSALVQERPLSRMRQEIALKQLRLRGGAADPSLRYQLNAQVQGTRFLDRERGGCFLRAKYRDVGALVTEQRKGLQEEGTFRQRLLKLRMQAAAERGVAVDKKPLFEAGRMQSSRLCGDDNRSVGSKMSSSSSTSTKRRTKNKLKSSRHKSAPAKLHRGTGCDVSVASSAASRRRYKRSSSHAAGRGSGGTVGARTSRASARAHSLEGGKIKIVTQLNSSIRAEAPSVTSRASDASTTASMSVARRFVKRRPVGSRLRPLVEARVRGAAPAQRAEAGLPTTSKGRMKQKLAATVSIYDAAGSSSSPARVCAAKPPAPVVLCSSIVEGGAPAGSKQLSQQLQSGARVNPNPTQKVLRGSMKVAGAPASRLAGSTPAIKSTPARSEQQQQQQEQEAHSDGPRALHERRRGGGALAEKEQLEEQEPEEEVGVADLSLEEYLSSQLLRSPSERKEESIFDTYDDTYDDDDSASGLGLGAGEELSTAEEGVERVRKGLLLWGNECVEVALSEEKLLQGDGTSTIDAYNWATQGVISQAHCQENFFAPPARQRLGLGSGSPSVGPAMALLSGGAGGRGSKAQRDVSRPAGPAIKLLSRGSGAAPRRDSGKYRTRAGVAAARVNQMRLIPPCAADGRG